jgi:hypothetical protein
MRLAMNGFLHQPLHLEEWIALIVLASVVGGLIIGAIAVVTDYFRGRERDEMDATLKMEMLERGMSAQEIIDVLKATTSSYDAPRWAQGEGRRRNRHCRDARRAMHDAMHASQHRQA